MGLIYIINIPVEHYQDMSAVIMQNRVATAQSLLPAEVTKIGVTTMKQQNAELKTFALYSRDGKYDSF